MVCRGRGVFLQLLLWIGIGLTWAGRSFAEIETDVYPWDGIRWQFTVAPETRIVAIGDIHGDFEALVAILRRTGLLDAQGHWAGGTAQLVLPGDLVDRGKDSFLVLKLVQRLEREALASGGKVTPLLGNHELRLFQGLYDKLSRQDRQLFRKIYGSLDDAFSPGSDLAEWMSRWNSIVRIGDLLFVHGGFEKWAKGVRFGSVNATVRRWVRFYSGMGPKPRDSTAWSVGEGERWDFEGPLWTRKLVSKDPRWLEPLLERSGARLLIVGHTPTESDEIERGPSPRLYRIDTGISEAMGGELSALEIKNGRSYPRQYERADEPSGLRARFLKAALCEGAFSGL